MWKNKKIILYAVLALAFLLGCGAFGWILAGTSRPVVPDTPYTAPTETVGNVLEEPTDPDQDLGSTIQINGQLWKYNRKLRTVLFLGIDSKAEVKQNEILGNGGRADVILLLVLNTDEKTIQVLSVSRDTMTVVDAYDSDRRLIFSGVMQLNMQYAFGDNPTRSCLLMKRKVSELLYGIPIDSCISVTMDGISALVEKLGGLTLTIPEDWTDIDPRYSSGAVVTLNGAEAERFIRYRDITETGSNDTRMERHAWLIRELFSQFGKRSGEELASLYQSMEEYMASDMDAEMMKMVFSYALMENTKIPGQTSAGDLHDEFYIDEKALKELLIQVFYLPAS